MKKQRIINIFISLVLLFLTIKPVYALAPTLPSSHGVGCGGGLGPIADFLCGLDPSDPLAQAKIGNLLNRFISAFINFLTVVAMLWFILQFIFAGYNWLGAGGDKNQIETARNKLTNSIMGLLIITTAWVIVGLIGKIMGLDILNPGAILQTIGI